MWLVSLDYVQHHNYDGLTNIQLQIVFYLKNGYDKGNIYCIYVGIDVSCCI